MTRPEVPTLISQIPEQSAALYGGKIALSHGGKHLTYAELNRSAGAFAARLAGRGIGGGARVVLAIENSFEYAICYFGCLLAGAAVVPVNPDTTLEQIEAVLRDSEAGLCVIRGRVAAALAESRANVLTLQSSFEQNAAEWFSGPAAASPRLDSGSTALILYTSGSTGRPKGVMLSHANLAANAASIVEYLELTANDSTVSVLPFYYSFGNSILLTHLAAGGRIVIENRMAFPNLVVETLQREKPTGFSGVPFTFYVLLSKSTFAAREWPFLRYIAQAGGGLRVEAVRQLQQILPQTRIFVMYGQTEASARLTYLPPERLNEKLGSVGIAIPGVEIRVVDEAGQPARAGEVGEVVARGANVMQSYWNLPEETAKTVRDGWLYTGDMGRLDEDGFLFLVSRKSDFIKSASYRISPGEIEEVVAALPAVSDVAVFGVEDELLGEAVAAAVVAAGEIGPQQLRQYCMQHLPFFKVPKYFLPEAAIPRTASGKIQYFKLRDKYRHIAQRSSTGAAG